MAYGTINLEAEPSEISIKKLYPPHNYVYKGPNGLFMLKKGKEKKVSSIEKEIDTLFIEDPSTSVYKMSNILISTYYYYNSVKFISNNVPYFHIDYLRWKIPEYIKSSGSIPGIKGFQAISYRGSHDKELYGDCISLPDVVCIDGEEKGSIGFFAGLDIEKITFSPCIKKIGKGAFRNCRFLQEVIFPDGCDSVDIDPEAFVGCEDIRLIRVPSGSFDYYISKGISPAVLVNEEAYLDVTVRLEKPGTILNELTLEKLNKIRSLTVIGILDENDIYVIARECASLQYLNLRDAYTTLSKAEQVRRDEESEFWQGIFQAMGKMSESKYKRGEIGTIDNLQVQLFTELAKGSSNVRNASYGCIIPKNAFRNSINLETVVLPARVSRIERGAFQGCTMLSSVILPPYLESIDTGAFANCPNLRLIDFPATLTSIGGFDRQRAYGNSGIASFINTSIEKFDFSKCSFSYNTSIDKSWTYYFSNKNLREIRLPQGVSNIDIRIYSNMDVVCYVPSSVKKLTIFNANEIHFASPEPPIISEAISDCIIYVPKGCLTAYYANGKLRGNKFEEE